MAETEAMLVLAESLAVQLPAIHIRGENNVLADMLSRTTPRPEDRVAFGSGKVSLGVHEQMTGCGRSTRWYVPVPLGFFMRFRQCPSWTVCFLKSYRNVRVASS